MKEQFLFRCYGHQSIKISLSALYIRIFLSTQIKVVVIYLQTFFVLIRFLECIYLLQTLIWRCHFFHKKCKEAIWADVFYELLISIKSLTSTFKFQHSHGIREKVDECKMFEINNITDLNILNFSGHDICGYWSYTFVWIVCRNQYKRMVFLSFVCLRMWAVRDICWENAPPHSGSEHL